MHENSNLTFVTQLYFSSDSTAALRNTFRVSMAESVPDLRALDNSWEEIRNKLSDNSTLQFYMHSAKRVVVKNYT